MKIIEDQISLDEIRIMARKGFGEMVKAVVDIRRGFMGIDAELHADIEADLIDHGSRQEDMWGINLYPDQPVEKWIEFDSMINIRPGQGNRSRGVDDEATQKKIIELATKLVTRV